MHPYALNISIMNHKVMNFLCLEQMSALKKCYNMLYNIKIARLLGVIA